MTEHLVVVERFLEHWTEQFRRAAGMFTGETPLASYALRDAGPLAGETESFLWWKQAFSGDGEFQTWVGAAEKVWGAVGKALGESETDACRSTYLELLGQTAFGTAEAASPTASPVVCGTGEAGDGPANDALAWATVLVSFDGGDELELLVAVEAAETARVLAHLSSAEADVLDARDKLPDAANSPMLERLRAVALPISIAVGSADLTIREVLALKMGSVVTLNKEVGETVELRVHNTLVAVGEIVEVKGHYGLRIKQIVSRQERLTLCPSS